MMEAILSTEASALTRATRRKIPEDCILDDPLKSPKYNKKSAVGIATGYGLRSPGIEVLQTASI
jgi:hypothetical protein